VHTINLRYFWFIHVARIIRYGIYDVGDDGIFLGVSTIIPRFSNYFSFGLSDSIN
jgi:hypothetical protein